MRGLVLSLRSSFEILGVRLGWGGGRALRFGHPQVNEML